MQCGVEGSWCPLCYSNRRGRSNYRGHWGYRRPPLPIVADVRGFMQRPKKTDVGSPVRYPVKDDMFMSPFPLLTARLNDEEWDDGVARKTDTLFLFMEAGRWKCMLKDRDAGKIAFYTAHTMAELFECIEAHLRSDAVDWKVDRKPAGGRR